MPKRYGLKTPLISNGSEGFAEAFNANNEHILYIASAQYKGCALRVASRNQEHYQRTIEYWKKLKATNIVEINLGATGDDITEEASKYYSDTRGVA